MKNPRKIANIALISLSLLSANTALEARIMAGSVSEKKQTTKVVKLLNNARKSISKGKNQDAIDSYWKVLELDSQEPYAYLELGELYKNLQIYDRSIEMLTSGLKIGDESLDPDVLCHYYCILTEVYSITHQQGLANKSLIKAAEIAPRNPMPRKILGDIYLKNNRIANAAKAYKKALELDPYYHPATKALEELKAEYGNQLPKEDKDKDYIKKVAVKLDPKEKNDNKPLEKKQEVKLASNKKQTITNNQTAKIVVQEQEEPQPNTIESQPSEPEQATNSKIAITDDRPLPLSAKEIEKINKEKERKKKKDQKKKPQTKEEIEKAIAEIENKETTTQKQNLNADDNERYVEMFLAGNPTQKEEAINYFINQGEDGLAEIEELIYDPNPDVRLLAVRALPLFIEYKDKVKAILQDAADDSDSTVAEEISKTLKLL